MFDLLAESDSWLEGERHKFLTQEITFRRDEDSVNISATISSTDYQVEDYQGNILTAQTVDFIVRPEDLGASLIPKAGDQIERTVRGQRLRYEVWTPTGADLFAYNTGRTSLTIHTQLIGEESC